MAVFLTFHRLNSHEMLLTLLNLGRGRREAWFYKRLMIEIESPLEQWPITFAWFYPRLLSISILSSFT